MRAQTLKIDHARYVVTLDGERRIIHDGSILVEGQRIRRVGKAAELAGAPADRVIDARHLLVTPGFVNGHMHISYAASRARHLPGRPGEPAAPRLPAPDGDDGGGGVPHDAARPRGAPQERHRLLRRSRQHEVPGRVSAGVRGLRHPRDPRRVRDGPGGAVHAAPVRHRGGDRPHRLLRRQVGRPARRTDPGVGDAVLAGDLHRRPAERAEARGRRARDRAHPPPRQRPQARRESLARHGVARPSTSNRSGSSGRTSCCPTCSGSTTPRSTASPGPARRWRCARSPRPRGPGVAEHGRMPELLGGA